VLFRIRSIRSGVDYLEGGTKHAMKSPRNKPQVGKHLNGQVRLGDRFNQGGPAGGVRRRVSWNDANPLELAAAIAGVVGSGDAIMFGSTSDGGAFVVTIFSGDDRRKWYPDDVLSAGACLRQIAEAYENTKGAGAEK